MFKPNRLWIKISIAFVSLIIVMMTFVTYTFTIRQTSADRAEINNSMGQIARMIASVRFVESAGWYVYQDWIDNLIKSDTEQNIIYIAVFDETNNIVAKTLEYSLLDLDMGSYLSPAEQDGVVERLVNGHIAEASQRDFDHIRVDIREGDHYLGKVDVGFSLVEFNNRTNQRLLANLGLFILFFVVAVLSAVFLGRRITGPITTIAKAMGSVSEGSFDQTIIIESNDEIGDLSHTFNYMTTRLQERQIIESFARDLAFSVDFENLQRLILDKITVAMGASESAILLKSEKGQEKCAAKIWRYSNQSVECMELEMEQDCCQRLVEHRLPVAKSEFEKYPGLVLLYDTLEMQFGFSDVELVVPIENDSEMMGLLLLSTKQTGAGYDIDEKRFLMTLTNQASFAIEHSLLLAELQEKEHLERELEIARTVQQRLLPAQEPKIKGAEISGICLPAFEVGGDYFDYFVLDHNKVGIAIADVSGKGTSAAFYMAEIKGMMASLAPVISSPKKLLEIVNRRLYESVDKRIFATMIYGILDTTKKEFLFVRAGHNALIIKRSHEQESDMLIPQGIGLGLSNGAFFEKYSDEIKLSLNSGDTLLLYTDGISEARNTDREEFGEDRLCELLVSQNGATPREMQKNILKHVQEFTANAPQHDDITMVLLKLD